LVWRINSIFFLAEVEDKLRGTIHTVDKTWCAKELKSVGIVASPKGKKKGTMPQGEGEI
jgi:hypothetical protein